MKHDGREEEAGLVSRARGGDSHAFGKLVVRYAAEVSALVFHHVGDPEATLDELKATIQPTLENLDLTTERMEELLVDKKVLVRVLAEEISDAVLTVEQKPKFDKVLTEAGYPKELVRGTDPIFTERVNKMLGTVADEAILELKKTDATAKKSGDSKK